MRSLSRNTIVPALALALSAVSIAGPAGAQEYGRPYQGGDVPREGFQRGGGAPRVEGPRGRIPQRGSVAPNNPVQAQERRRGGNGAGVAAGVIGGLAAGAILGGILSNRGVAAEPGPGFDPDYDQDGCPPARRAVYDAGGRFAGYQTVPSC